MKDVQKLSYLFDGGHHELVNKALKSFEQLQKAWVERSITRILRACNNVKFSRKLTTQIEKMTCLDVYNFIRLSAVFTQRNQFGELHIESIKLIFNV